MNGKAVMRISPCVSQISNPAGMRRKSIFVSLPSSRVMLLGGELVAACACAADAPAASNTLQIRAADTNCGGFMA